MDYGLGQHSPLIRIHPIESPFGSRLMPNMIQSQKMHYHAIPIIMVELIGNVSCHVVVHFGKILATDFNPATAIAEHLFLVYH